jgi:hypothetical protein
MKRRPAGEQLPTSLDKSILFDPGEAIWEDYTSEKNENSALDRLSAKTFPSFSL